MSVAGASRGGWRLAAESGRPDSRAIRRRLRGSCARASCWRGRCAGSSRCLARKSSYSARLSWNLWQPARVAGVERHALVARAGPSAMSLWQWGRSRAASVTPIASVISGRCSTWQVTHSVASSFSGQLGVARIGEFAARVLVVPRPSAPAPWQRSQDSCSASRPPNGARRGSSRRRARSGNGRAWSCRAGAACARAGATGCPLRSSSAGPRRDIRPCPRSALPTGSSRSFVQPFAMPLPAQK